MTIATSTNSSVAGDYAFTFTPGALSVTPRAVISVSLTGAVSKTYDGNSIVTNLTIGNYHIIGFVPGEGATISLTTGTYDAGMNVGGLTLAVTSRSLVATDYTANIGTSLNDYHLSAVTGVRATGSIGAITPAPLTVTADDESKPAGTPNPPFTATYAGFVAGEGLGDLGGSLLFSTPATVSSPVGSYLITPSGLTSSNYAISFIDGLLFVTASGTVTNPAAVGAITSIFAIDDRFIRTTVEIGDGLVDALNLQPPPTEKQISRVISVVDCGINVPGALCNSR